MKKIREMNLGWMALVGTFFISPSSLGSTATGGEVPIPFEDSNQRVELADGEIYTLIGRVRFQLDTPYLEVDLGQHPWLANSKRKLSPVYPIDVSPSLPVDWKVLEGKLVKSYMRARGFITKLEFRPGVEPRLEYRIGLEAMLNPIQMN
jgi:hypothetical protein